MKFCGKKPGKLRMKLYSSKVISIELLRERFENALEISEKTQGVQFLKNVATPQLHRYQRNVEFGKELGIAAEDE